MDSKYIDDESCVEVDLTFREKIRLCIGLPVYGCIMVGRTVIDRKTGQAKTISKKYNMTLL